MCAVTSKSRPLAVLAVAVVGGLTMLAGCSGENPYQAARSANNATTESSGPRTATSVLENDFLPEANLSSCVGLVERPNCGSESKGDWRMILTFVVLMSGMGFIGWRVVRGARARDAAVNRVDMPASEPESGSQCD